VADANAQAVGPQSLVVTPPVAIAAVAQAPPVASAIATSRSSAGRWQTWTLAAALVSLLAVAYHFVAGLR
jgi:hypothetical protein